MSPISAPVFPASLINEPAQSNPATPTSSLGPIEHLVGTWTNKDNPVTGMGGPTSPYSYNVMPLPQGDLAPAGYILKNFSYYEEITFSAIHGNAPNRGGTGTQVANTLFYEQRVYFAEGPGKDSLVHAENGSWLFLTDRQQNAGPYCASPLPSSTPPTQPFNLVKQISVPHGNSILAAGNVALNGVGGVTAMAGSPIIPASTPVLPKGVDTTAYTTQASTAADYQNPNVAFTNNPNQPLINAITAVPATSFIQLNVDTKTSNHPVSNINFEQKWANVTEYEASYWLEAFGHSSEFTQLQYSQTIYMNIPITGAGLVSFPHITTNTLTKI
ncbi:MAG: hypothetical protein ACI9PY_001792 [Ascidiaceihabitans sp.]|jgi:hypothetical protein